VVELGSLSLAQAFTPGKSSDAKELGLAFLRRLSVRPQNDGLFEEKPPEGGWIEIRYFIPQA